ncbi:MULTISPECIES: ExbD/TolR family protein [Comamonadaceae]|jgi:biopolymer transport protein TolR|uniref:ExbD/TolR family protein n=1 Tax=Comamonadaceae TaxID=80864 RepID=UPI0027282D61|nr:MULTISPECIES: biopolymer transporter ExbD [Comamonadaceae]MDO9144614.1 biopolymer transporter ExbD [Rhodoferax sp.]MDP2442978.1 biopolymer transporter ExbD [Rhodoferax sp.]MDP3190724.1 biopolymer transporter ExbD [Rhodoferax sp.]MDP3336943.1 biopolymer transporter ExbD [Rhodoferax sp.]MDP3883697.1 biopolymer transporter ExbD [Hydrogenophaga sp.]
MAFGRLDRSLGDQPMSDINMTPLIDVMLVLVVIFIITAPLLASSIKLDLPTTEAATASDAPQSVTVVVDAAGLTYLQDRVVAQDELLRQLQLSARVNPQTEVLLRADKAVPYGRIVEVMGAAQTAGLNRIGFVADAPAAAAKP